MAGPRPGIVLHRHPTCRRLDRLRLDRVLATVRGRLTCRPLARLPLTATATVTMLLPQRLPSNPLAIPGTRQAMVPPPHFRSLARMCREVGIRVNQRTRDSRHTLANLPIPDSRRTLGSTARLGVRWVLICRMRKRRPRMGKHTDTGMDIPGLRLVEAHLDGIERKGS